MEREGLLESLPLFPFYLSFKKPNQKPAMTAKFDHVFEYMKREDIGFDQKEFLFQVQSHPDYPTLLSIADTLSFLKVRSGALAVDASEIELLPEAFMAQLDHHDTERNKSKELYYVYQQEGGYRMYVEGEYVDVSREVLEERWGGAVLLIEPEPGIEAPKKKSGRVLSFLGGLLVVVLGYSLYGFAERMSDLLFVLLPIVGILLSMAALKDLFGADSNFVKKFCSFSVEDSCSNVVTSKKWKVFEYVNFSDLAIVFFSTQFLSFIILLLTGNIESYFGIQKALMVASVPVLGLSIYYQKFIENTWCPICLSIGGLVVLETGYLFYFSGLSFNVNMSALSLFAVVGLFMVVAWGILKKLLSEQKSLKEFQFKATRFIKNYENFRSRIIANPKKSSYHSPLVLGNPDAQTVITAITSPFCSTCQEVHQILDRILEAHGDRVRVEVVVKTAIEVDEPIVQDFMLTLMGNYVERGPKAFQEALHDWIMDPSQDVYDWIDKYEVEYDRTQLEVIYVDMNTWCIENDINFTPFLMVNNYIYPTTYDYDQLDYLILDVIEDPSFWPVVENEEELEGGSQAEVVAVGA